jgi:hypothetical protein
LTAYRASSDFWKLVRTVEQKVERSKLAVGARRSRSFAAAPSIIAKIEILERRQETEHWREGSSAMRSRWIASTEAVPLVGNWELASSMQVLRRHPIEKKTKRYF